VPDLNVSRDGPVPPDTAYSYGLHHSLLHSPPDSWKARAPYTVHIHFLRRWFLPLEQRLANSEAPTISSAATVTVLLACYREYITYDCRALFKKMAVGT
jgi:hypothetical protein